MIELKHALRQGTEQLSSTSNSARLDAEVLLSHVLRETRAYLYAHGNELLATAQLETYQNLINQRIAGVPIAYLIKHREFWSLDLEIQEGVLIPRPETELLVELCLQCISEDTEARILDLGTGSGAIALAIASERPNWFVLAVDNNELALNIARSNATRLNVQNIRIHPFNWFETLDKLNTQPFHAIVSNPPYLSADDPHLNQGDVRFEPHSALISNQEGLADLFHIAQISYSYLLPDGLLLLEHGYQQSEALHSMLKTLNYTKIQSWQDLQGHNRVISCQR